MVTSATYDYRVLQPYLVTDPNGNRKENAYTPLGLVNKAAVMGKATESKGDTLDHPTSYMEYDFFNFVYNGDPVWVKTYARERHYYNDASSPYLVKADYSDGMGRLIQSRAQAEDVLFGNTPTGDSGLPADQSATNQNAVGYIRDSSAPLNVIVSGWQVYNNKGKVVEKFEPFFSSGFDFIPPGQTPYGQKIQMFYDPRGEVIRTLHPDGTQEKIVFGEPYDPTLPDVYAPTAWVHTAYDANDLTNGIKAFGTPKYAYIDALGRTIKSFEKNIYHDYVAGTDAEQDIKLEFFYDIRGNLLKKRDPLGRLCPPDPHDIGVFYIYDLENKLLRHWNLDAGEAHATHDAMDRAVLTDNANGAVTLSSYDVLSRPHINWARDNGTGGYAQKHVVQYGDSSSLSHPEDYNLLGKVYRVYDEAGRLETPSYDFKGNPLSSIRRVIDPGLFANAIIIPPPLPAPQVYTVDPYRIDWTGLNISLLDTVDYTTDNEYDALNRITLLTYPAANGESGHRRIMTPTYNNAGALEKVDMQDYDGASPVNYVERITYNARGQKLLISYGNTQMTRYVYDNKNFRLLRMKTEKYAIDNTHTGEAWYVPQSGNTRQDFAYEYDPLGNILQISDCTPTCGVGGTDSLERHFRYDALYRLLKATGRENLTSPPYSTDPYADNTRDDTATGTTSYRQCYQFDEMGNIIKLRHKSDTVSGADFTRLFSYDDITHNNYLSKVNVWSTDYPFEYDNCGNQTLQNTDSHMLWDYAHRMYSFYIQAGTSEPSQYAQYCYDGAGQRVMKVVRTGGGAYKVRIYIGGHFEEYYEYDSGHTFLGYQDEIMIMDGSSKIASDLIGTTYSNPHTGIKYILSDHLGSSNVLCNDMGGRISREEYFPFGETSFGSYTQKRYRFSGKEKDEESGLYYYGARYYLSWTCRFVSSDPMSEKYPVFCGYQYANNRPINLIDINGEEASGGGPVGNRDAGPTVNNALRDQGYSESGIQTINNSKKWASNLNPSKPPDHTPRKKIGGATGDRSKSISDNTANNAALTEKTTEKAKEAFEKAKKAFAESATATETFEAFASNTLNGFVNGVIGIAKIATPEGLKNLYQASYFVMKLAVDPVTMSNTLSAVKNGFNDFVNSNPYERSSTLGNIYGNISSFVLTEGLGSRGAIGKTNNWMSASKLGRDLKTSNNYSRLVEEPGFHQMLIHGTENHFLYHDGMPFRLPIKMTPKMLAGMMIEDGYVKGTPVLLISCDTGIADKGAAYQLSRYLKAPVKAPTNWVTVLEDGGYLIKDDGIWRTFHNTKIVDH